MYKLIKTPFAGDEHDLITIEISLPNDITGNDLGDGFEAFMLACGFHPNTVKEVFNEDDE